MQSIIKDKILYSPNEFSHGYMDLNGNIGEYMLRSINDTLSQYGDMDWLINGPYDLKNDTSTCGPKRLKVSQIEGNVNVYMKKPYFKINIYFMYYRSFKRNCYCIL